MKPSAITISKISGINSLKSFFDEKVKSSINVVKVRLFCSAKYISFIPVLTKTRFEIVGEVGAPWGTFPLYVVSLVNILETVGENPLLVNIS